MLSKPATSRSGQQGITLIIAMVILAMIMLASVALIRSLDTTNLIAGNLAFQQSAAQSGDEGVEAAVTWLEQNNTAAGTLSTSHNTALDWKGYTANRASPKDPDPNSTDTTVPKNWDEWWKMLTLYQKVNLATDAAGNTVSYTIHRMCDGAACFIPPVISAEDLSGSKTAGNVQLNSNNQIFYRITVRISGPRWTKTYIQAIVAL